jgi:hypothetical protein
MITVYSESQSKLSTRTGEIPTYLSYDEGEIVPVKATRTYWEKKSVTILSFLTSARDGGMRLASCHGCFTSGEVSLSIH